MTKNLMSEFHSNLFHTPNRFVMGSVLRLRADVHTAVPHECTLKYYAQRASAGLLISEPLHISLFGPSGAGSAGMYDDTHVRAWKNVTDAVHEKGGRIFANLFHAGRRSHSILLINQAQPIAPSSIAARRSVIYQIDQYGMMKRMLAETPRAMTIDEIDGVVGQFALAAEMAMAAGFDGVEIDAGHGYLIDQFLRSGSNQRDDDYGGSKDKRQRFAREVISAVGQAVGFAHVGLLVSPEIFCQDMADEEINQVVSDFVHWASGKDLCYLNCALTCLDCSEIPPLAESLRLRELFDGPLILTGNWPLDRCDDMLASGTADLIGFDRLFISNPDLPARYLAKAPVLSVKRSTIYGGGREGYVDYPCLDGTVAA